MILKKLRLLFILLGIFLFVALFGDMINPQVKSFFYAVSLTLKQGLLFIIPFIIFSLVFYSLVSLKGGVFSFVSKLVGCVYVSNFTAIMVAYLLSSNILPHIHKPLENLTAVSFTSLTPMWEFSLPAIIPNETALLLGFGLGIIFSLKPTAWATKIATSCNTAANVFLRRFFIPLLPLFMLGLVIKLENDQLLQKVTHMCGPVLLLIVGTQITYISFLYLVAAGFRFSRFVEYIKNIFPATITAFSSMSSLVTMPLTIIGTEQNLRSASLARLIIPATVNIHTLGSALGLTTLAIAISITFTGSAPTMEVFVVYALFYAFAKFSVACVPGGAVVVAIPLMEKYLGFTPEMAGLVMAIYMLFDPFGTATNVTANGAFAVLFKKIARLKASAEDVRTAIEDGELLTEKAQESSASA